MAAEGITAIQSGVQAKLQMMVEKGKSMSSYFNRITFQNFKNVQNARFQTENASQGDKWEPIDPESRYGKLKPKKFATYPGAGRALMVATGKLASGALAKDSANYYKAVTDRSFIIGMNLDSVPYAKHAGDARPYMTVNSETLAIWKKNIVAYMTRYGNGDVTP